MTVLVFDILLIIFGILTFIIWIPAMLFIALSLIELPGLLWDKFTEWLE